MASALLTPAQQQAATQLAQQAGIDPTTATNAVAMISADGPAVSNAISALQKGNPQQAMQAVIPIVAGAVGIINPVAGAVVGGALAVGETVLSALGLFSSNPPTPEPYNWKFPATASDQRAVYFTTPQRPYGPGSSLWLPLSVFAAQPVVTKSGNAPGQGVGGGGFADLFLQPATVAKYHAIWNDLHWLPNIANPNWLDDLNTASPMPFGMRVLEVAGAELQALGDKGTLATWWSKAHANTGNPLGLPQNSPLTSPGLRAFALVFGRAFQHALEYPLNGFNFFGGYELAQFLAKAWNSNYPQGAPVTIDGSGNSLVDMAVAGWIDQWGGNVNGIQPTAASQNAPITINVPTATQLAAVHRTASAPPAVVPHAVATARLAPRERAPSTAAMVGVGVAVLLGLAFFL